MKKKSGLLKKVIFLFVILTGVMELYGFFHYIDNFINGFTPTDFVGNVAGNTVYGFQAIKKDGWSHLIFAPVINVASIFQIIYVGLCVKEKERDKRIWIALSIVMLVLNIALWLWIVN